MTTSLVCWADHAQYARRYKARPAMGDYLRLYQARRQGGKITTIKGMDASFSHPVTAQEREIHCLILAWDAQETIRLEGEYFAQHDLLRQVLHELGQERTDARLERRSVLIVSIAAITKALEALQREDLLEEDCEVYPGAYVPVMTRVNEEDVVTPMQLGRRASDGPVDLRYPIESVEVIRQEDLARDWNGTFGHRHAVITVDAFFALLAAASPGQAHPAFAHYRRARRFSSLNGEPLMLACVLTGSTPEHAAASFSPVTNAPSDDMTAAGLLRGLVHLRPGDVAAWLQPDHEALGDLAGLLAGPGCAHYGLSESR